MGNKAQFNCDKKLMHISILEQYSHSQQELIPFENKTLPIHFNRISKTSGLYILTKLNLSSDHMESVFLELYPKLFDDPLSSEPLLMFPKVNIFDKKFYTVSRNPKTVPVTSVGLGVPLLNIKLFLEVVKVSKMNKEDI